MQVLDLSERRLLSLPAEARKSHVFELNLCGNLLTNIPVSFSSTSLRVLVLARNRLGQNFDLGFLLARFPRLEELDLSENEIRESPGDLEHSSLRILKIGKNRIRVLSSGVWDFPALEILDLAGAEISRIESGAIWNVPDACRIDFSDNHFSLVPKLPVFFCREFLLRRNLRIINCNLSDLDTCISADLSNCEIRSLTGKVPTSLRRLDLSGNQLDAVSPDSLRGLSELNLSGNAASFSFGMFPWLKKFNGEDPLLTEVVPEPAKTPEAAGKPAGEAWEAMTREVLVNPVTSDLSIRIVAKSADSSPVRPRLEISQTTNFEIKTPPRRPTLAEALAGNEKEEKKLDEKVQRLVELRNARAKIQKIIESSSEEEIVRPRRKPADSEILPLRSLMLRRPRSEDLEGGETSLLPVDKRSAEFVRLRELVGSELRLVRAVRAFNARRVEGLEAKLARLNVKNPSGRIETVFHTGPNLSEILLEGFKDSPVILGFGIPREPAGLRHRLLVCGFLPGKTFESTLSLREAMKGVLPWSDIFRRGYDSVYFPREHAYAALNGPSARLLPAYLVEVERLRNSTDQT